MTNLYYNWLVSIGNPAGVEWVSSSLEEFGKHDSNGNTITQCLQRELTVEELPVFSAEIAECYFGSDGYEQSDRQDFIDWIGDGGEAVAEKIDWDCGE